MTFTERIKGNRYIYFVGKWTMVIYHNIILDSIRYLKYMFFKAIPIPNKYNYLRKFKDLHKGDRCFIVATGPSLTTEDLNQLKGEICFGVNSAIKISELDNCDWKPDYFLIQDSNVYEKLENDILNSHGIREYFVGDKLYKRFKSSQRFNPYYLFSCFHGKHGQSLPLTSSFSYEYDKIVYDGYSVTYSALQLAVYMGFKEIYLIGTDCNYDKSGKHHFIESGFFDKQAASVGERMIYAYQKAVPFLEKKNIQVYNCTRGGMLEVFDRKSLEEILSSNE